MLELAQEEGRRQGVSYVGTEHILLGLIREGEGVAARVLVSMGLTLEKLRRQVLMQLGGIGPCLRDTHRVEVPGVQARPQTMDDLGRDLTRWPVKGSLIR